jgi:acetyl-CoA/propionyl-CoA carboxylase biotin carboxyl carrier protein
VDYDSVGTVEFLVQDDEFFFLEMNTRVQVEHPVTEEVMGVDVVKAGIRIALGEGLPISQEEVRPRGHAIEVRINAEDPAAGFAPSPGEVTAYAEPGGPGVRVDSSLSGPGTIPEHYDPLFAKLISYGADREEAIARLRRALSEFRVEGIATTLPFHKALLDDEVFLSGRYTTGFVAERLDGMDLNAPGSAGAAAETPEASVREVKVEVDGKLFRVRVFSDEAAEGRRTPRRKAAKVDRTAAGKGEVVAPMQGTIVKVLVEEGWQVAADEPVCVLEAMKMESEIRTRKAGTVARVAVTAGQTVKAGAPLVTIE